MAGKYGENIDYKALYKAAIETNFALFDNLKEIIQQGNYDQIIVALGSNRQSVAVDYGNMFVNRTPSAAFITSIIQRHLQEMFPEKTSSIDSILLPDLFSQTATAGDQQRLMIRLQPYHSVNSESPDSKQLEQNYPFDENKFMLVYTQLQRAALLANGEAIDYVFVDDKPEILKSLSLRLRENADLLPRAKIKLMCYGSNSFTDYSTIQTSGTSDNHYEWTVRGLVARFSSTPLLNDTFSSKDLQSHFKNHPTLIVDTNGPDSCYEARLPEANPDNRLRQAVEKLRSLRIRSSHFAQPKLTTCTDLLVSQNHPLLEAASGYYASAQQHHLSTTQILFDFNRAGLLLLPPDFKAAKLGQPSDAHSGENVMATSPQNITAAERTVREPKTEKTRLLQQPQMPPSNQPTDEPQPHGRPCCTML